MTAPSGGRDAIDGVAELADGTRVLAARVRSAPKGGEANRALCALVADKPLPHGRESSRGQRAGSSRSRFQAIWLP
jgi:hypothetical protein